MKIALLGYGKMGREVEKIALEQEHTIVLIIDNENDWLEKGELLKGCDVAIEFSMPAIAIENIRRCFDANVPIVVGTTGWYDQFQQISDLCVSGNKTLFYSTNFSIGVNIFFDINRRLASLLQAYPMYSPAMVEIHHTQKLDAPSGTAITLANDIIAANPRFTKFTKTDPGPGEIAIQSIREGNVPGTHTITWTSEIDQITITHEAKGRRGLAAGALMAAEWVQNKQGVYTMKDILSL
ncbi:MAG: 4-hydroxy-tetrahydrodipicolinate reductase [Bacteroidales bacterium]|nr:4-hydroxy-tetrahydrodipicolinate reductase [Bacteroidales bacterium]